MPACQCWSHPVGMLAKGPAAFRSRFGNPGSVEHPEALVMSLVL